MTNLEISDATVFRKEIKHRRTRENIPFKAVVEKMEDGAYSIRYSHVPKPKEDSGIWYSDSLSAGPNLEIARGHIELMIEELEKAFSVHSSEG